MKILSPPPPAPVRPVCCALGSEQHLTAAVVPGNLASVGKGNQEEPRWGVVRRVQGECELLQGEGTQALWQPAVGDGKIQGLCTEEEVPHSASVNCWRIIRKLLEFPLRALFRSSWGFSLPHIIDGMWVDVIQEPVVAGGWLQVRAVSSVCPSPSPFRPRPPPPSLRFPPSLSPVCPFLGVGVARSCLSPRWKAPRTDFALRSCLGNPRVRAGPGSQVQVGPSRAAGRHAVPSS